MQFFLFLLSLINTAICLAPSKQNYILPVNRSGYTSVHSAALDNDPHTIEAIGKIYPKELSRPSEYNKTQQENFQDTPAHLAAYHGCWDALVMLVAYGATIEVSNSSNCTPYQNVKNSETCKYRNAIKRGKELLSLRKNKTASIMTSTTPINTVHVQTETKQTQENTVSTQTDPEEPYQTITLKFYGALAQPIEFIKNILPPPYDLTQQAPPPYELHQLIHASTPLQQQQSHQILPKQAILNANAKPYQATDNRAMHNHPEQNIATGLSNNTIWTTSPHGPYTEQQAHQPLSLSAKTISTANQEPLDVIVQRILNSTNLTPTK